LQQNEKEKEKKETYQGNITVSGTEKQISDNEKGGSITEAALRAIQLKPMPTRNASKLSCLASTHFPERSGTANAMYVFVDWRFLWKEKEEHFF
jgi:hypothetical protein